jgi:hypothetical protein
VFVPARRDAQVCSARCRKLRYRRLQALRSAIPLEEGLAAAEVVLVKALAD